MNDSNIFHSPSASKIGSDAFSSRVPLRRKRERHGMSRHALYAVWVEMLNRCHRPSVAAYRFYGARGIRVCPSWRYSFLNFYRDMGERPTPNYQLDRIDSRGNYEPGNVRWSPILGRPRKKVPLKLH